MERAGDLGAREVGYGDHLRPPAAARCQHPEDVTRPEAANTPHALGTSPPLPDGEGPRRPMVSKPAILGDEPPAVLDCGRIDQAVGWVAGE